MDIDPNCNERQFSVLIADTLEGKIKSKLTTDGLGYKLCIVDTKEQAVEDMILQRFDLIIIDKNFVANGLMDLVNDPQRCPNFDTPIIALTDTENLAERKTLIQSGFDDCLTQPLTLTKLHDTLNLWGGNDVLTSALKSIQSLLVKLNGNQKIVLRMWQKLFEELPQQLGEIQDALRIQDYLTAYDVVHKLNGSAKVCDLFTLQIAATDMENTLQAKPHDNIGYYHQQLQKNINALLSWQTKILDHLQNAVVTQ